MSLVEVVQNSFSLIEATVPLMRSFSPTNLLISVATLTVAWLAARASSAIVGEYGKRFWFTYVDRDAVRKRKDALAQATSALDETRRDVAQLKELVERLRAKPPENPAIQEASEMLLATAKYFRQGGLSDKALYCEKIARRLQNPPANDQTSTPSKFA